MTRKPSTIPRIAAPLSGLEQHAGGGYTIHGPTGSGVTGNGVSLDAAWKDYKNAVLEANAAEAMRQAGKEPVKLTGKQLRAKRQQANMTKEMD